MLLALAHSRGMDDLRHTKILDDLQRLLEKAVRAGADARDRADKAEAELARFEGRLCTICDRNPSSFTHLHQKVICLDCCDAIVEFRPGKLGKAHG